MSTYNQEGTVLLDETEYIQNQKADVEMDFPLYWALGTAIKWNNNFYTTLDLSQTWWSDFSFKAEGEDRINPLNGQPYGDDQIDDCWSVRVGTEYLVMFPHTEWPIRAGIGWDQQPAVGRPDEYWSASLGTGISLGKDPVKCVLDVAYTYRWGNDVMGSLVPEEDISSDVESHQVYLSNIWHF